MWATNASGWDLRGADLQCVVCRDTSTTHTNPADAILILLVTRADITRNAPDAFRVLRHPSSGGHHGSSSPHIYYNELRVPAANLLAAPGTGAGIMARASDISAAMAGAMAVGIMRATFETA